MKRKPKDTVRTTRLHCTNALPLLLTYSRRYEEPYAARAYDACASSWYHISALLAADVPQIVDKSLIRAASGSYKQNWLQNPNLPSTLREPVRQLTSDLDALDKAISGGWSQRMFPIFGKDDG